MLKTSFTTQNLSLNMAENTEVGDGSSDDQNEIIKRSSHVSNSNKGMSYLIPNTSKALPN